MMEMDEFKEKEIVINDENQSQVSKISHVLTVKSEISKPGKHQQAMSMMLYTLVFFIIFIVILLIAVYTDFNSSFVEYYFRYDDNSDAIDDLCSAYDEGSNQYGGQSDENNNDELYQACVDEVSQLEYYQPAIAKTRPLFALSFIISFVLNIFIDLPSISNILIKRIMTFFFVIFQILVHIGFALVAQFIFGNWDMWSCIVLIGVTYLAIIILAYRQMDNQTLAYVSVFLPLMCLLAYGGGGFQVECLLLAPLFALTTVYWINQDARSENSVIACLPIFGVFMHYFIAFIQTLIIEPFLGVARFTSRNTNKLSSSPTEQQKNHLIIAYTIIIIVLGASIFANAAVYHSNFYEYYGHYRFYYLGVAKFEIVMNSFPMVCTIITPLSHFIAMMIYLYCGSGKIGFLLSHLLIRLELVFVPLFFGGVSFVEKVNQNTDGLCVEYVLFFCILGVITLLATAIGEIPDDKFYNVLPMASLILIIYQQNYQSIAIGATVGYFFTYYVKLYSNILLTNKIIQISIDDTIFTAAACINPAQIFIHFQQSIIHTRRNKQEPHPQPI